MAAKTFLRRTAAFLAALVIYAAFDYVISSPRDSRGPDLPGVTQSTGGEAAILAAFRDQTSGVMVEADARVVKSLRDDLEGSRHQKFIVELSSGHTVLISHNIDLAPRVPFEEGDRLRFRGQYEWNDRGGVVHWTHHDPQGRRDGGWIRHRDRDYR